MITKIEALSFLKEHQPMPKDEELKNEIEKYEEVRNFFSIILMKNVFRYF